MGVDVIEARVGDFEAFLRIMRDIFLAIYGLHVPSIYNDEYKLLQVYFLGFLRE